MIRRYPSLILALMSVFALPAFAATDGVGKIISLKGAASVMRMETTSPLAVGDAIHTQDVVHTTPGSIAEIQFDDESVVTVGTNSQLIIDAFVYDPQAREGNESSLRVGEGFFHFVSGKLARDKVKLETPVSTIGIRGTELAGEVEEDGKTLVSLVECCVDVLNESGKTSLDRIGTFTQIKTRRNAPSSPALTPDWWAEEAVAALGKTRSQLGLDELENEAVQTPKPDSKAKIREWEEKMELDAGPKNRKSFPYFDGSLIEE